MGRFLSSLIIIAMLFSTPARAQDAADWQVSITAQIEALRDNDGKTALAYAGAGFRARYDDPAQFLIDIARAGYTPIALSRSHGFGDFDQDHPNHVLQLVRLVGEDQGLHEAVYELVKEPGEGWRIAGVMLRRSAGLGI